MLSVVHELPPQPREVWRVTRPSSGFHVALNLLQLISVVLTTRGSFADPS